ncbi:MAG: response regulator, partial [Candidatus Mariimomonas ferrooxydans]
MNQDSNKGCILVVDDDTYVLDSITNLLKEYGYSIVACKSGEEAMAQFQKNDFELVLTDIKMPWVSGIELLEKIHVIDSEIPVVLRTAYADMDIAIAAIKQGAFDFITKPYESEYLLHTIEKAIRYINLLQLEKDYRHRLEDTVITQTQELSNLNEEIIYRLTSIAEFRDTDIGAHIARMGIYSNKIAESLNMPTDFINA